MSDEDVMERLVAGDDSALHHLLQAWRDKLATFLYRQTGDESAALDLAQETFVRVYLHRHRYHRGSRFSTWLFAIAVNLARHHRRRESRHPTVPLEELNNDPAEPNGLDPLASLENSETAARVRKAIQDLPADLREVVLLSEYERLPQEEIARIVGSSRKAVEGRLYRAKARLRESLHDMVD